MPDPKERRFMLCTGKVIHLSDVASDREKYAGSHIIGEVVYRLDGGIRMTALAVFENCYAVDTVPPANPELIGYAFGDARDYKCRFGIRTPQRCARKYRWEIGKAAMSALMSRMGLAEKLNELEKAQFAKESVNESV